MLRRETPRTNQAELGECFTVGSGPNIETKYIIGRKPPSVPRRIRATRSKLVYFNLDLFSADTALLARLVPDRDTQQPMPIVTPDV